MSAQESLVEVSWREPSATNGIITQYTLSVTSSVGTNNGDDGITVNQVETFNKACARFCAVRTISLCLIHLDPKMLKLNTAFAISIWLQMIGQQVLDIELLWL